jgi:hypothetical protein
LTVQLIFQTIISLNWPWMPWQWTPKSAMTMS